MTTTSCSRPGLNANQLRTLAMILMLIDHVWAVFLSSHLWMTYLGRLAFPIFAFQISEGFFHTSDRRRYAKRLLLFALLSEIPFDLVYGSTPFYPFHQNVLFTLLLGLLGCCAIDRARQIGTKKAWALCALSLAGILLAATVFFVDYGWRGAATVLAFYALRDFPGARLAQLCALAALNILGVRDMTLPLLGWDFPTQGFAVGAIVPIWLYNGQRGGGGKTLQYAFYAFYPVHLLVLYLLFYFR